MTRALGYIPDVPSPRDWNYAILASVGRALARAENLDMLGKVPAMLDQGRLGSCVANAGLAAVRLKHVVDGIESPELASRLLGYYLIRGYIGTEGEDSGGHVRNLFRALNQYGFCRESDYPYETRRFAEPPPPRLFRRSFDQRTPSRYWRISSFGPQRVAELKAAIDAGNPVVCGSLIGQAFIDWDGAIGEKCPLSVGAGPGHAFYAVAYNELGLICCNSWGDDWGDLGRFTVSWSDSKLGKVDDLLDLWVVEAAPYFSETSNA